MNQLRDTDFVQRLLLIPEGFQAEFFRRNAHQIQDDAVYWSVLGSLWKAGGTVIQQDLWLQMFNSPRKGRHKIMKSRERKLWRRLPQKIKAYRAVNNHAESEYAISWTLNPKTAAKFSNGGIRPVVEKEFSKSQVFAFFDRRGEDEILVNIN